MISEHQSTKSCTDQIYVTVAQCSAPQCKSHDVLAENVILGVAMDRVGHACVQCKTSPNILTILVNLTSLARMSSLNCLLKVCKYVL